MKNDDTLSACNTSFYVGDVVLVRRRFHVFSFDAQCGNILFILKAHKIVDGPHEIERYTAIMEGQIFSMGFVQGSVSLYLEKISSL